MPPRSRPAPRTRRGTRRSGSCTASAGTGRSRSSRRPVEHVQIPYEGTTLEGYLFTPNGDMTTPRPTVDPQQRLRRTGHQPVEHGWARRDRAGLQRARPSTVPVRGRRSTASSSTSAPTGRRSITPVVDWLVTRPEVDPDEDRAAGHQPGRVLGATRRRVRAPARGVGRRPWRHAGGVVVGAAPARRSSCSSSTTAIRRTSTRSWTPTRTSSRRRCSPGAWRPTAPPRTTRRTSKAREQTLDAATVAQIQCPTLVLDPEHEQFWPGQSQQLYDALTCEKQLARFTAADGADWHCEPAAQSLRDEVVFDFLETVYAR